jgi:hypothetical protein
MYVNKMFLLSLLIPLPLIPLPSTASIQKAEMATE